MIAATAPSPAPPATAERRPRLFVLLVTLMLVACTVGWRRGQYFSGALDPVVAAKAALSVVALGLAFAAARRLQRHRLGTGSLWFLAVLLAGSAFGALTHGTPTAGGVVAARVAVLGLTTFFLLRIATIREFFAALSASCAVVGLAATVTGLSTLGTGRLAGGLPPLSPNELALLAGLVVLHAAWRTVLGEARLLHAASAAVALGVLWSTGSRTGLLMLLLALAVMALHIRRAPVGLVAGGLAIAALGTLAAAGTGALASFAERDGTGTSTLDSRFIAWRAATDWADSLFQLVFGGGLSVKIIPVQGQYWTEQPLDSSWVSLLVQTGLLGLLVAAGWVLWTLHGSLLAPRPQRALFLGLLVYLVGRSLLESGLFDATPAFLCLIAVSVLAEGGTRPRLRDEVLTP